MYEDVLYVAGTSDEARFREYLVVLGLQTLPERPDGPTGLAEAEIERNRCRMLSLKPMSQVPFDPKPFPHYSPAVAPLLEWDVSQVRERRILAGHIRHHPYMEKEGPEYREIGRAFSEIKQWMKLHWKPMNQSDFMGPEASRLVAEGFSYSSFDPAKTSFLIIDRNGK